MAETTEPAEQQVTKPNATDMVVESGEPAAAPDARSMQKQKRPREEGEDDQPQDDIVSSKKQKVENEKKKKKMNKKKKDKEKVANEEQEKGEQQEEEAEKKPSGPIKLGYKTFESSLEIFDYFFNFLHIWPLNVNVNKYEHTMLLELLKNGDIDHDGEFGGGISAFQVRKHPEWQTKWFYLIREDESVEAFSFRKCVEHIRPLPEEMQPKPAADHVLRGKRPGGRGRGGRDGGRTHEGRGN